MIPESDLPDPRVIRALIANLQRMQRRSAVVIAVMTLFMLSAMTILPAWYDPTVASVWQGTAVRGLFVTVPFVSVMGIWYWFARYMRCRRLLEAACRTLRDALRAGKDVSDEA